MNRLPIDWETRRRIGCRLKAARERSGLSQREVGKRAGMHQKQISNIENGEPGLSIEALLAFAKATGTTASAMLEETPDYQI